MKLVLILTIGCLLLFPLLRCFVFNFPRVLYYVSYDLYKYVAEKGWNRFGEFGIFLYIGMFGHGKSLSCVHKARKLYKRFGDSLLFISNIHLLDIPYVPLVNFNQLLSLGSEEDEHVGYVVIIDEVQSILNNREFAKFPIPLLSLLTQQRKKHVVIYSTCQRFFMVDKLYRSICTYAIDCNKFWRFQHNSYYDAWDYENAMNPRLCQRLKHKWWFVSNKDYNSYDTTQMIDESAAEKFISNDETLARLGVGEVQIDAIKKPSARLKRRRKKS